MTTARLYYHDATLLSFDAVVIAHSDGDPRKVVLDQTAFYPTSGGQPHDTGTLAGAVVLDVIDDDDVIVHVVDVPVELGPVHGIVDATRRHDHMQQHTAQHLLSALAGDRLGWHTVSVHFGAAHSAIEFDAASIANADLEQLEQWANTAVAAALPVSVTFDDAATATGLRKPPQREGEIRVIGIEGIDRSACGGTHVSRTSEIGPVMVTGYEKLRGRVRVAFLAGARVIAHAHRSDTMLHELAAKSSCSAEELLEIVPRRQAELASMTHQVERLEREVAVARVERLFAAANVDPDGMRRVVYRATDDSPSALKAMAQSVGEMTRVLFVATGSSPPSIVFGTSADSDVDAGAVLKAALTEVGGRGGGAPRFAQGSAPDAGRLRDIVGRIMRS